MGNRKTNYEFRVSHCLDIRHTIKTKTFVTFEFYWYKNSLEMSGGLTPNSQTFLAWNKLMIDMSNIFFFTPSAVYSEKVQNVNNKKMFTFWNELHTTDKLKTNCNIHDFVSWFAFCLIVHMHFLTWILWGIIQNQHSW